MISDLPFRCRRAHARRGCGSVFAFASTEARRTVVPHHDSKSGDTQLFEPDLSEIPHGDELLKAAARGPEEAKRAARRIRAALDEDAADDLGARLAALMELNVEPPGRLGSLVAAAAVLAGPATIARAGGVLRQVDGAEWKTERGLEILNANRSPPAAIQLLVCSRDARDVEILRRARENLRGYPALLRDMLRLTTADAPPRDLDRFFALGLELAMIRGTRFTGAQLTGALSSPGRAFLEPVVWARYTGRQPVEIFVLDPDGGGFVDVEWEPVDVADDDRVGVLHPAECEPGLRELWGPFLADNELVSHFPQFDRICLTARPRLPYDRIDREVPHWDLARFLYRNGWDRDRESRMFDLKIRGAVLGLDTRLAHGDLRRLEGFSIRRPQLDRAGTEDDIVYSEAVAACIAVLEEFAPDLIAASA